MTCDDCKFAEWKRTAAGRLHPDGSGQCKRLEAHPLDMRLPSAFHWGFASDTPPKPNGGYIERKHHHKKPCAFKAVSA